MLQLLNFIIMMLNGLLGIAIAKVLEVAACLFWSDSNAPEGDFDTSLSFLLIFSLCSLFLMYDPSATPLRSEVATPGRGGHCGLISLDSVAKT